MNNKPKRHHWWPLAQSRYWTDHQGFVFVTKANGKVFSTNPINIGVESELYTRFVDDSEKDTAIEEWFAQTIDGPASKMINHLLEPSNVHRKPFHCDPLKAENAKALGFRVNSYVDRMHLPVDIRYAIASYIAALLVRHPNYLKKLIAFHENDDLSCHEVKILALDNMLHLYKVYRDRIAKAAFLIMHRTDSSEFIYADGGILVDEPWRRAYDIPFDIHAPLTPDIALQVLPIPQPSSDDLDYAFIVESTNQGVARLNRIILGGASRFVFSRQSPPIKFITNNFGKLAPKNIGYRIVNGRLETSYEPERKNRSLNIIMRLR